MPKEKTIEICPLYGSAKECQKHPHEAGIDDMHNHILEKPKCKQRCIKTCSGEHYFIIQADDMAGLFCSACGLFDDCKSKVS